MKNIFVIVLLIPFLFACPPDDDGDPPMLPESPTTEELVIGSWKINKVIVNNTTNLDTTNYSFSFLANKSFNISAPDVDDPDFPSTGTWKLISNDEKILLNDTVELDIIIDDKEFIIEYSYKNFKEGTVTFQFEMVPAS